jgi:hypothetical protein
MSATLKNLRDQIIIDSGIEGNPKFPPLRLNRIINLAQRYVQTQLNGLGIKKWEAKDALTLTPDTFIGVAVKTANLSTDCPNMLESPASIIFIETSYNDSYGIAYEIDIKQFEEQILNSYLQPTPNKPIFMRLANKIYIAPNSITSASAYYYKAVTDLANDTDTTEIPLEFEEYIIKRSVMEIDSINGKLQDKQLALQQLDAELRGSYEKFLGKMNEVNRVKINDSAKLQ